MGLGLDERLNSRVSLRQEFRVILGEPVSELRAQIGMNVALGRYPNGQVTRSSAFGATPLRTGQHIWITGADGIEMRGVIGTIADDRLELVGDTRRDSFSRSEIGRLRTPDSLRNGLLLGAAAGGAALTGVAMFLSSALCEGDCEGAGLAYLAVAVYGAGFGAIAGAIVDSAFDRPRTIYDRSGTARAFSVAPIADRRRLGARAQFGW